jgi:hypothetical protein
MSFARFGPIGFLSHLRSLRRYDEQEILHFSLTPFCLVNADAGHRTRTTLASLFFRNLQPDELRAELARQAAGTPPITSTSAHDIVISDHWSPTSHSLAEHAWLLTMLPYVIDYGGIPLSRPPDFMLGIASQYLGRDFDPVAIVFGEDDAAFQKRVRSFRQPGSGEA